VADVRQLRIVHTIARLNVGGAALSVLELAAGQQQLGHDVLVVAGTIPAGEASMEYLAAELGVPYQHVPELQRELSPRHDTAAVRTIHRLLRARHPHVLHTHTAKAGTTGRVAALLAGRARPGAVVHTYHGHVLSGYFEPRRERAYRLVERALAHATDALIAVSDEVRDDLVRFRVAPREKFAVIPYGFDLDRRIDSSEQTRAEKRASAGLGDDFVIGWAGRLTEIKRPQDLIRVLALLPGAVLVLAGDGELRAEVEQLAATLGVADRVRFLGYIDDLGSWYAAFDTFLLTSANEGAPVVAIEALAAGLPVVATAAGGTGTVVDDGETGLLAPVGDVAALAAQVERLRNDDGLRAQFGAEGARRMRERFSTARMVDDVEGLYRRILAR
jgi:glycosyltransferase involved in cell wall biosynthesis